MGGKNVTIFLLDKAFWPARFCHPDPMPECNDADTLNSSYFFKSACAWFTAEITGISDNAVQ